MKTWSDLCSEAPALAKVGMKMLFPSRPHVGYVFLATIRKDGAPRLHPISLIVARDHFYVMIPETSPKCADLLRDGRFALQAFPPVPNVDHEEFYISGSARQIPDPAVRKMIMDDTRIKAEQHEILFELFPNRVMYTRLVGLGTADEHPVHQKWKA